MPKINLKCKICDDITIFHHIKFENVQTMEGSIITLLLENKKFFCEKCGKELDALLDVIR